MGGDGGWDGEIVASDLYCEREQPAFCMLRRECLARFSEALEGGERRLGELLRRASEGAEWQFDIGMIYEEDPVQVGSVSDWWFTNVNTPEDLAEAEAWARRVGCGAGRGHPSRCGLAGFGTDGLRESVHHRRNSYE